MAANIERLMLKEMLESSSEEELSLSSSETSSDEEVHALDLLNLLNQERKSRNCITNYCDDVVPQYSEREFITHFRVSRTLTASIAERFATSDIYLKLVAQDNTRASLSPLKHMLTFLWFAGHQTASYRDVADRFDISISSLYRIISRISEFLSGLSAEYIKWPNNNAKQETEVFYRHNKGFPSLVGSIDGTHIQIDRPTQSPDDYINRKGVHTIVVQAVCNEKKKFIDIFIGFPGSVHDARVFRNSPLFEHLAEYCEGSCILGDSAYPCLNCLLTPYRDNGHLTRVQKRYNRKLSSCRVDIEHTFGILKQRFRQLYHLKLRGHARICHFIRACCVLHSISSLNEIEIFAGDEVPEEVTPDNDNETDRNELQEAYQPGGDLRDEIARQVYLNSVNNQ